MTSPHAITVEERQSTTIAADLAASIPADFWKAADCTVQRSPGDTDWTLSAGDSAGVTRLIAPSYDLTLNVTTKLPSADVFFLADYAFGQRHEPLRLFDYDSPLLDAVRNDPTACLLMWHARSINQFAARWLRRDYRTRDRVFDSKVKGRILLDRYVKEHVAVGQASTIPCRTIERTQDTPNNRILKAGLRYIAALSHTLPVQLAGRAVAQQVAATLPRFAQVSDINPTAKDYRAVSTRGPQRHYGPVLRATLELLSNRFLSDQSGSTATQSFMWQMPTLFQESVRGIIANFDDVSLDPSPAPRATISTSHGKKLRSNPVDPDLVITAATNGRCLLLDTKYKNALPQHPGASEPAAGDGVIDLASKQRIKVNRADIYQAVAYRQHDRWHNAISGLLYPVCLHAAQPLPQPLQVAGFGDPIYLAFIDIGPHAAENLLDFHTLLTNLVAGEPNS